MLAFSVAYFFMIITPGPGVLSIAGVGAGFGFRPAWTYMFGLLVGTNVVAVGVVTGLAAAVFAYPALRNLLLAVSILYLIYLALKIAFAGSKIAIVEAEKAPGFMFGMTLQILNPKAYVVNGLLFTGFPFWPESLMVETAIKFVLLNVIWIPIHCLWLAFGVYIKHLSLAPMQQRAVNMVMALSMLAVVGIAALNA